MADESTPASPTPETPPPRTTGGNWRWEPPTVEELQALMPGYTIEKLLGRGGMGAVYRGVQTNLDRPVAIKILPPGVEKEDPSFAERFKSEARLMAKLNHPAVVAVYDFGKTSGGQLYFAMEYVDGSDVSQMISAQGRLPAEHALAITAHVCDALGAAHELGIVHRDIKPANVLLNMKGQVKVADFGLAKVEEPGAHGLTKTGYAMGTPDFVAPEALTLGTAIDGRADIYAVGVMLYQMLTGNIPRGAFKPAFVLVPGLDPRFDPIIIKAMQHDREERYQSSAELRRDLDVILTVPLVQRNAPESAAIPVSQVAQMPAQRSAAQKPVAKVPQQRSDAGAAAKKPEARKSAPSPVSPPAKSKAPLFLGLGVAAALGIGAFVMMGGKKEAKTNGAAAAAEQTAGSSKTSLSPSREPWTDMLKDPTKLKRMGSVTTTPEGQLRFTGISTLRFLDPDPKRDGAVRMLATFGGASVQLQARRSGSSLYMLKLEDDHRLSLGHWQGESKKVTILREMPLPQALRPGQNYELELRAVGPALTARFNGEIIGTATDRNLPEGGFGLGVVETNATPSVIKALELLDLDGARPGVASSSSPPVPKSSDAKFPPGQWVKAFSSEEQLRRSLSRADARVKLEGPWIRVSHGETTFITLPKTLDGNYGVRCRALSEDFSRTPRPKPLSVAIRRTEDKKFSEGFGYYMLSVGQGFLKAFSRSHLGSIDLINAKAAREVPAGGEYELECAVVGSRLILRRGEEFKTAISDQFSKGQAQISSNEDIRDLEVINLDGLSEAEALKILGVDEKGNDLRKAASSTSPVAKASDAKFPPGQWVKVFAQTGDLPMQFQKPGSGVRLENGTLVVDSSSTYLGMSPPMGNVRNAAFRMTTSADSFNVRLRDDQVGNEFYLFKNTSIEVGRRILKGSSPDFPKLVTFAGMAKSEKNWEFAAVGGMLVTRRNGKIVGLAKDDRIKQGPMVLANAQGTFREFEVMNLDGLSEAEALKILGVDEKGNDVLNSASSNSPVAKAADAKFPPGQWVKMYTKAEDLPDSLRKPDSGVKFEDGAIVASQTTSVFFGPEVNMIRNGGWRATISADAKFEMRVRDVTTPAEKFYGLHHENVIYGERQDGKIATTMLGKHASLPAVKAHQWEFVAVENQLIVRCDGLLVNALRDERIARGKPAMFNFTGSVRDIEVINLDGLSEAEALKLIGVDEKGKDTRGAALAQEKQAMEQAKVVDAASAIPELKVLHEQLVKLTAERVTAPFEADVAKLNAGYVGGIDRKITEETAAGHLDGVIALEAEKKLLTDKQPIPADDAEGMTANLKALRAIYRAAYAKIEAARVANLKALTEPLTIRLKTLETELTKQKRVPDAKTVRDYREKLADAGANTAAHSPAPGAAAAKSEPEKSARAQLKKFPPGDDRKAAEWALDLGGNVTIRGENGDQVIRSKAELPKRGFDLTVLNLAGSDRPQRQTIEYQNLLPLAGLRKLNNVAISSLPVTDDDTEILASLPEMNRLQLSSAKEFTGRKLGLLKEATKLNWMNLGGCGITAEGLEQIGQFTELIGLQLNNAYLEDKDLPVLKRLKKLTWLNLSDTKVTLEGWKQLKGLPLKELGGLFIKGGAAEWCQTMAATFPEVRKLEFSAREAVGPEDVAAVAAFPELREFIFASSFMDDATVGAVADLTKLEVLSLRGGGAGPVKGVTDAGMERLMSLKKLLKLRLEAIDSISPKVLTNLAKLKDLTTLELMNCQQLDPTATADFVKLRPDVKVTR